MTVIRGRVSDLEEAEDLGMAVFELAWTRLRGGETVALPWLYRCARNVVGNEYHRRNRNARLHLRLVSDYEVNSLVFAEDRDPQLAAAVKTLPVADREIVAMVYWYDLTLREAAEVLGVSEASVKMRMSRLRRRLRILLSPLRAVNEGVANG